MVRTKLSSEVLRVPGSCLRLLPWSQLASLVTACFLMTLKYTAQQREMFISFFQILFHFMILFCFEIFYSLGNYSSKTVRQDVWESGMCIH